MTHRRWTILIVPPGNGPTRTVHVGRRTQRAIVAGLAAAGLLVVSAVVILFTPYATPGSRMLAAENERLRVSMTGIDDRLRALSDTLVALGARDAQMRVLAGLTADTAAASADRALALGTSARDETPLGTDGTRPQLRKPFLGRLGFSAGQKADIDGMIKRAAELSLSFTAVSDTLTRNVERLTNTPSIMPTTGWLTSHFTVSRFHPVLHENLPHEGIDVSAPMGAPIIAPAAGVVKSVSNESGYGNTFQVDHGNGIVTKFAHCSRILVRAGQRVTRGQLMATVGSTGITTGPHLHYEVHVDGKPVDPLKYVLPAGKVAD